MSEYGGDGSGAGQSGSFASPGPASGQAAIPAPQGPVTRLSNVAGIILLLVGLGLTAVGGYAVVDPFGAQPQGSRWIGVLFGSAYFLVGLPALLGGIGILRGANWGRWIGIFCSVSYGLGSLAFLGLLGLTLVPFLTYSAIVLIARWREPATA